MRKFLMTTTCAIAIVLGGCNTVTTPAAADNGVSKSTIGLLLGGALGGLAGSQIGKGRGQLVAVGVGVFLGALIGRDVGSSMDKVDRMYVTRTAQNSLEHSRSGTSTTWNNPDTGNYGNITPVNTFRHGNRYCREYQTEVTIGGERRSAYGTACRQPDGSWEIVNNNRNNNRSSYRMEARDGHYASW